MWLRTAPGGGGSAPDSRLTAETLHRLYRITVTMVVLLTVAEVADGGAVLAAGRVVDLLRAPSRLGRDLFFGTASRSDRVSGRTLGPAERRRS